MEKISIAYLIQSVLRYLYLVIAAVIVFALGAFFYSKYVLVPRYSATGSLLVTNGAISSDMEDYSTSTTKKVAGSDIAASADLKPTIVRILQENMLYKKLAEKLTEQNQLEASESKKSIVYSYGTLKACVSVSSSSESDLYVDVTFTSENPAESQRIVNELLALAPEYIESKIPYTETAITEADYARKTYPSTVRNIFISGLFGAVIALIPIILLAFFNNTIQTENDLIDNYEIPVIGNIPDFANAKSGKGYRYNYNYGYGYNQKGGYGYYGKR